MRTRTAASVVVAVVLVGAYGVADAADVEPAGWPGLLTVAPPWEVPSPFPTVALTAVTAPLVLAELDAGAPRPDPADLAGLTAPLLADPRVAPGVGVAVVDVLTDEVLLDVDAAAPRTPASTVKLLTTTAALSSLGPRAVLPTRVLAGSDLATDAVAAGAAPGTIHLVGGGDVLLSAGPGEPGAVVGRAGLADLAERTAQALDERGVEQVRVVLDDTLFTGPSTAPGWGPVDLGGGFVAPVAALAVDRGVLPGRTPRDPDAALTAARTFAGALGAAGIRLDGDVSRAPAPGGAPELAMVASAPVAELVEHTLETSDNDVAEVLGRLTAVSAGTSADFAGAAAAVLARLEELGLDVSDARLADASGLSELNAVPPIVLARLVALTADDARPDLLPVATGMPVAGLEGTLADRYGGPADPAAGVARAKTGSLLTVASLAGLVVTADGRLISFAVVADAVPVGGVAQVRASVDAWVNRLATCGCS